MSKPKKRYPKIKEELTYGDVVIDNEGCFLVTQYNLTKCLVRLNKPLVCQNDTKFENNEELLSFHKNLRYVGKFTDMLDLTGII